jgi:hypothetical protein
MLQIKGLKESGQTIGCCVFKKDGVLSAFICLREQRKTKFIRGFKLKRFWA